MKLYDHIITECISCLDTFEGRRLPLNDEHEAWSSTDEYNLILRSDMAYELGGSNKPAVSGLAFTSSDQLIEDEVWLYGLDLPELKEDSSYARITILKVSDNELDKDNEAYSIMRKIEYTRYHVNPQGFMMRISAADRREVVRIGRKDLESGLNFAKAGQLFIDGYHKQPQVLAVKMIFITLPDFPYKKLEHIMNEAEKVTDSLNHIFNNLKMDCSTCGLKPVCDEVEGMRELHFARTSE